MARMTHVSLKLLLSLVATALGAAVIAGCGNDLPPGAVAKVGDTTISQDEFDKWLSTAVKGQAQGGTAVVPDPPDYSKCVAAKQKTSSPEGSQGKQSESSLKKQCKTEYETLKKEVMQFLIQAEWVQQEADKQDVKVSDAAVRKSFDDQKKQAFPNEKAYQKFLSTNGMSEADILFRVKLDQLQQKLTQKITDDAEKVSDSDIEDYYDKNKKRFAQPERRDLLVVLTKTKDKAEQAKQALDSGQSWKTVVKQYSIDQASKAQGGSLLGVTKGTQEKAFGDAVFKAAKGELQGPIKVQFGYYVFQVQKITPAKQQSLKEATPAIKQELDTTGKKAADDKFNKDLRKKWKERTNCRDGYVMDQCKNAPKPKTQTAPAGGGAVQAPPPPQQP